MPTNDFTSAAIQAALYNNWKDARLFNEEILAKNPNDVDALNRLAYAYLQLGKIKEDKRHYKKVITLDSYNQIAKKNLLKLNQYKKITTNTIPNGSSPLHPDFFLEEPGRTKTITLINIAPFSLLSSLTIGKEVFLSAKRHTIEVRDINKAYLGALPDDISYRLIRCLKAGNTYTIFIKNVSKNTITVFVKELKRGARLKNQPSFVPQLTDYQASIHKEIVNENEENKKDDEENFT